MTSDESAAGFLLWFEWQIFPAANLYANIVFRNPQIHGTYNSKPIQHHFRGEPRTLSCSGLEEVISCSGPWDTTRAVRHFRICTQLSLAYSLHIYSSPFVLSDLPTGSVHYHTYETGATCEAEQGRHGEECVRHCGVGGGAARR